MHERRPTSNEDDSPAAMAEMLRAFQRRQELETELEKTPQMAPAARPVPLRANSPPPGTPRSDMDMPDESRFQKIGTSKAANSTDAWKEEWLYPVDAWTLILGIDMPHLENGVRDSAKNGTGPDPALFLKELERLRGLRVLQASPDGKIRRDDAVRVAYRLGYRIDPGTPAHDILIHIHGIVPANDPQQDPPPATPATPEPVWMGIIQAAVAALVFFPDLAATAGSLDAPARILETILDHQILSPDTITSPDDREYAESQIRQILLIVRASAAESSQHG